MRILYYGNIHLKDNDGPSAHVLWICRELGKRGHRVLLFTYPFDKSMHSKDFIAIQIPDWPGKYERFQGYKRFFWRICGYLVSLFFKADVIYQRDRMEDLFPLSLSQKMSVPLTIEMNGWPPTDNALRVGPQGYQTAVKAIRERYEHACLLISTTAGARDSAMQTFDFSSEKVVYIRNGVDICKFSPPHPYQRSSSGKLILGYVFGFHPDLDVGTILSAVSLLKEEYQFELRLVTYSPNVERWQTSVEQLGMAPFVRFICNTPQTEIPKLLWEMDVCLAVFTRSYIRTYNGMEGALKLWEYWASQRPVIATDTPDTQSYHHHLEKRYLAVEPENPAALAEAIKRLYQSPKLAEELAHNGHQYVQHGHTWADTAREIEEVLQRATGKR
jgi:colanic acid biosynthesis glycosyl transferase WcaI